MIFKPSKQDEEIIQLLKKSGSDFKFDPNSVKYRLLNSIAAADQKPLEHFKIGRAVQYSVGFASVVVLVSATFAIASNSKPGDKLFGLNKFGENVVLKLPLSVEQKAKVQEYIVTNRLEALDQVNTKPETKDNVKTKQDTKNLETIKESDESLMSAVDKITESKKKLEASGKTQDAEKLEKVLDKLQDSAQKREAKIKKIEEETKDAETKAKIRKHLKKIEQSRKKARSEIKRFKETDEKKSDDLNSRDD